MHWLMAAAWASGERWGRHHTRQARWSECSRRCARSSRARLAAPLLPASIHAAASCMSRVSRRAGVRAGVTGA